jgi:hypothetical protein
MLNKLKVGILAFSIIGSSLFGAQFNKDQEDIFKKVYKVSKKYSKENGYDSDLIPKIISAMCLTETSFGLNKIGDMPENSKDIRQGSLGLMQVRVNTAIVIAKNNDNFSELLKMNKKQIANKLLNNDEYNIKIATEYLLMNKERYKTLFKAISAYNGGLKNIRYVKAVLKNLRKVEEYKQNNFQIAERQNTDILKLADNIPAISKIGNMLSILRIEMA